MNRRLEWRLNEITFSYECEPAELADVIREITKFKDEVKLKVLKRGLPLKLPTVENIKKFILSRPGYEHTFRQIMEELLGRVMTRQGDDLSYYKHLHDRFRSAQKEIERERHGKFQADWINEPIDGKVVRVRHYVFAANDIQERKELINPRVIKL